MAERVNTREWDANAVALMGSPLSRLHRRWLLGRSGFARLVRDPEARILDLGCGPGPFLAQFRSMGYRRLAGVEPDADLAAAIPKGLAEEVRNDKAEALSFEAGSFDAVWVYGVLHHLAGLDAYRAAAREIHRVLKPGGAAFILEPGRYGVFRAVEAAAAALGTVSGTFRAFSRTMEEERPLQHFFMKNHGAVRGHLRELGFETLRDGYAFYSWIYAGRKR